MQDSGRWQDVKISTPVSWGPLGYTRMKHHMIFIFEVEHVVVLKSLDLKTNEVLVPLTPFWPTSIHDINAIKNGPESAHVEIESTENYTPEETPEQRLANHI